MRIPRTNFQPTAFSDQDDTGFAPEQHGLRYDVSWSHDGAYGSHVHPGTDRSRFRSPILRASDPGELADGTLESHFLMAPNVRFTRTPDRDPARRQRRAEERLVEPLPEPVPPVDVAETATDPGGDGALALVPLDAAAADASVSVNLHVERLRAALAERRAMSWKSAVVVEDEPAAAAPTEPAVDVDTAGDIAPPATQPEPATPEQAPAEHAVTGDPAEAADPPAGDARAEPAPAAPEPVAGPRAPVPQEIPAQTAAPVFLSDFAFWESVALDLAAIPPRRAAEAAAPVPVDPDTIAARFRVVDIRASRGRKAEAAAAAAVAEAGTPVAAMPSAVADLPVVNEPPAMAGPSAATEPSAMAEPAALAAPDTVAEPAAAAPAPPEEMVVVPDMPAAPPVQTVVPMPAVLPEPAAPAPPPRGIALSTPFQIPNTVALSADGDYQFPPRALLQQPPASNGYVVAQETLEQNAGLLESVLEDFGIRGEIIHVRPGPVVTLYEFEPAPGVKSSRVIGLADDIARSMSALSARVAVVPGRNVIGIELPNATRETVYFRQMIESRDFATTGYKLPLCLGKTIGGEPVIAELAKMPHLLVAGTTGSGKSVAINTMILSLLYRFRPEECRLIMVDPKMLELSIYDGIPHLLTPVVTDPKKAVMALKWAVREMEDRYRKMSRLGVRNIDGYNVRAAAAREKGETITCLVQTGFDKGTGDLLHQEQEIDLAPMPYIVVVVDEMADLMMVAGKEIEGAIQRLAQMARAAGIHLIMATQRPSVDVITGTIKANFPTRISFQVTSKIDSRTILGEQGAEQLLGQGDMLHMAGGGRIVRVHGPFVSDAEVENVVTHLRAQGRPEYLETVTEEEEEEEAAPVFDKTEMGAVDDSEDLYQKAVKVVLRDKKCSTSYIQRRLGIGYNRAASLVERMEKEGLVGAPNHVGKREIIKGNRDAAPPVAEDAEA
ncbi:DNA translocase FtsK [Ensifer soli]|uniref:DNA translocase FtsK n=1 Tax=Ciceribacter sp. sgz301302 TaxID=3342379 RepID=UPI0035B70611